MPTSTLDGYSFTNLGPLTTTWTAAESCSTAIHNRGVALTEAPHLAYFYERCDFDDWEGGPRYGDCIPSGEQYDEYIRGKTDVGNPLSFVAYHSPGLECPASWTTAGIAAKDDNGSISATGIFSMTEFTGGIVNETAQIEALPTLDPWHNRLAHALDNGETAVVCCPSDYTVGGYGMCYSNFPVESITTSTLCFPFYSQFDEEVPATFTYNDEIITGIDYSATGTSPPQITYIETLIFTDSDSPSNIASGSNVEAEAPSLYTGYTRVLPVALVQVSNDGGNDGDGGRDDGDGDRDDGDGDRDGDRNAGSSGRAGLSNSLVALAAVWIFAGIVGAVLMAPF